MNTHPVGKYCKTSPLKKRVSWVGHSTDGEALVPLFPGSLRPRVVILVRDPIHGSNHHHLIILSSHQHRYP